MTDPHPSLGTLLDFDRPRDAIHMAIIPVVAAEVLTPGCRVALNGEGRAVKAGNPYQAVGVVDPFLIGEVSEGRRFWLLLAPGTITSMRHHWATPDFPEKGAPVPAEVRAESTVWLMKFASDRSIAYDEMVAGAASGKGATFGVDCHGPISREWGEEVAQLFWEHMEVVTGCKFPAAHRMGTCFSCACN